MSCGCFLWLGCGEKCSGDGRNAVVRVVCFWGWNFAAFENISVDFFCALSGVDAVAVAGGLAGDEDADRTGAAVDGLMRLSGGDLDALA